MESTSNLLVRLRRIFGPITRQNLTRAKAFDTEANRSCGRKGKPYNSKLEGWYLAQKPGSVMIKWLRLIALNYDIYEFASVFSVRQTVPGSRCIFQVSTFMHRWSTIPQAKHL